MLASIKRYFDAKVAAISEAGNPADQERAYQLATATLLIEMTRADHEVKPIERDAVTQALQRAFDLDTSQTEELLGLAEQDANEATSLFEFTRLINEHFDADQKQHFVELLWHVALADGEIDKYEDHLVRKVADLIHVPHLSFVRAKHDAMARMKAQEHTTHGTETK